MCANPKTKEGFKIIWSAARDGNLDLVRILIREGQDANEQTQDQKNTAIHLAAKNGHILIVKYLIEQKASVKLVNAKGKRAYDLAAESLEAAKKAANPKEKVTKGSLIDRLTVTEKTLVALLENK
jgi:ankyrin repeat protein